MTGRSADQPALRRDIGPLGSALLCFNASPGPASSGHPIGAALLAITGAGLLLCIWAAAQGSLSSRTMLGASLVVGVLLFVVARRRP